MTQIENRRKEEGRDLVEFYADTSTAALPRDVLETLNPYRVVLGKGVHRQAIFRMLDIWPDASVRVIHRRPIVVSKEARVGLGEAEWTTGATYTNAQRLEWEKRHQTKLPFDTHGGETQVIINPHEGASGCVIGMATCSRLDQFDKRRGTEVAFRRALRELTAKTQIKV